MPEKRMAPRSQRSVHAVWLSVGCAGSCPL